jgi:hypothetical protein
LRGRLFLPALKQELTLSRDREGAVLLADSAEYCKSLMYVELTDAIRIHKCAKGHTPEAEKL